jgi:hypothetical protein
VRSNWQLTCQWSNRPPPIAVSEHKEATLAQRLTSEWKSRMPRDVDIPGGWSLHRECAEVKRVGTSALWNSKDLLQCVFHGPAEGASHSAVGKSVAPSASLGTRNSLHWILVTGEHGKPILRFAMVSVLTRLKSSRPLARVLSTWIPLSSRTNADRLSAGTARPMPRMTKITGGNRRQ